MRYYMIKNARGHYAGAFGDWVRDAGAGGAFADKKRAEKYLRKLGEGEIVEVNLPSPEEQDWEEDRLRGRLDD
jgi:hypothetical protein